MDRLADHLLRTGLAQSSLRQLAAAAGVSDRMLVYYFSNKSEALAAAMARVAGQLAGQLAGAMPEGARLEPGELIARAALLTTGKAMRPYMRLWIEVVAAAARGEPPFVEIAHQIATGFLKWIEARLAPGEAEGREATAAAILAMIDGLALLEVCAGEGLTARAAATMGALSRR